MDRGLDADLLSRAFRRHGRLHIPGFLRSADAEYLRQTLEAETGWQRCTLSSKGNVDIPVSYIDSLPPEKRALIETAAHGDAARVLGNPEALHYLYDTVRFDGAQDLHPAYAGFHAFLNSAPFLDFIRRVTGLDQIAPDVAPEIAPHITYVDARASRYLRGHYLTEHDDHHPGQQRLLAYVLNLSPVWLPDWGGLLNFIDADGHVAEAYAPRMNALNLFRVPQKHAVSLVTPFAMAPRYSITGWIRADRPSDSRDQV